MALLDWLRRLLGGRPPAPAPQARFASPGGPAPSATPPSSARREPAVKPLPRLSLGAFAPITDDELQKTAKALGRPAWTNPWFGRRDLIPPVDDARTLLIDRGMVSRGLVTPERLAEIHEVGAEMDRVRPDIAHAGILADQAVARADADRARIKAEKKAEAERRRAEHARAVAERRKNDIVYLGRGVSGGLADRRALVEKLAAAGLPVLATPADVARELGIEVSRLRWLCFHSEAAARIHYVHFEVPKKSGGTRLLSSPHRDLGRAQEWVLRSILDRVPVHAAAHGFVTRRSIVSNAGEHVGKELVLNLDLHDFFPTVTFPRVEGIFAGLGYSPAAATVLALLATESPRRRVEFRGKSLWVATGPRSLPQGACTSPALSNLVVRGMDARLAGIARKLGWSYTRYADDLTFSASGEAAGKVGYLMARVRHIAEDEGFVVNEKKTRVLRRNRAQEVTGVVVNDKPSVPRRTRRRLRAILHRAAHDPGGLAAQNRRGEPDFEAWLDGMIAFVAMVSPEQAAGLRDARRGR